MQQRSKALADLTVTDAGARAAMARYSSIAVSSPRSKASQAHARAAVVLGSGDQIRMLYEDLAPYGRLLATSGAGAAGL